jgi:hypothetical protein
MNDLEHARTGTNALGRRAPFAFYGRDLRRAGDGASAAARPEFVVVNLISELMNKRTRSLRACPKTKRRSVLPCFVMWPRRYLSADALRAGAKPT